MIEMLLPTLAGMKLSPIGQQNFTNGATFTVPDGVDELHAVCIGAGGMGQSSVGSSGGDLRWRNGIKVTPGEQLGVQIGGSTGKIPTKIWRVSTGEILLQAKSGDTTEVSTPINGTDVGGGNGGKGSGYNGGGAGGYSGDGASGSRQAAPVGSGAGGTGGTYRYSNYTWGTGGGGVGLLGQSNDGVAGPASSSAANTLIAGGGGGSGGGQASGTQGGLYGGGGAYGTGGSGNRSYNGAARLIWGPNRGYPRTNTKDLKAT